MSGQRLLLDSTFIAGLINSRDQLHLQAKDFLPLIETAAEVVITEAVLIEVGNLLHLFSIARPSSLTPVMGRRMSPSFQWTPNCFAKPSRLYRLHQDKDWGLTDCISFVVMKERGLVIAMTADTHFRQA